LASSVGNYVELEENETEGVDKKETAINQLLQVLRKMRTSPPTATRSTPLSASLRLTESGSALNGGVGGSVDHLSQNGMVALKSEEEWRGREDSMVMEDEDDEEEEEEEDDVLWMEPDMEDMEQAIASSTPKRAPKRGGERRSRGEHHGNNNAVTSDTLSLSSSSSSSSSSSPVSSSSSLARRRIRHHKKSSPRLNMAFGRRVSTVGDRQVNAAPSYGTSAFDKRMELDEEQSVRSRGSSGVRRSVEADKVKRRQRWNVQTAREEAGSPKLSVAKKKKGQRSRGGGEEVGDVVERTDVLDVDVLRQLRTLRSVEKKRTTALRQGGEGGGGQRASQSGSGRLTPSPPKSVAGRISEVPHSNEAAVRRWERRPFS
jgi:hypothetical protein